MTTNPKINSILDEANRLFILCKFQEAISYYDKILEENPNHLGCLNNKGYALSKLKNFKTLYKFHKISLHFNKFQQIYQIFINFTIFHIFHKFSKFYLLIQRL